MNGVRCKFRQSGWLVAVAGASLALVTALSFTHSAAREQGQAYSYNCEGDEDRVVVFIDGDRGHLFARKISAPIELQADGATFLGDGIEFVPDRPEGLAPGQTASIRLGERTLSNCRNDPRAAVWEGAKLRGVSYRAIGQEPGWVLEIDRDKGFLLVTGYGEQRDRIPYAEPVSDASTRSSRYESKLEGETLVVEIVGENCRDTMSGEAFSSRVTVEWRGATLRGCGRALH